MSGQPRVLVAHPFPDLYGADLMLLRSLRALRAHGTEVVLCVPEPGPLLDRVAADGVPHRVVEVPVLRKALLAPRGLAGMARGGGRDLARMDAVLREVRPDVVYVNTLTLPHWLAAARRRGVPAVCHVRELESSVPRPVAWGLTAPLRLATTVVANSHATAAFLAAHHPRLAGRTTVVHNGFAFDDDDVPAPRPAPRPGARRRLLVVGRLSPRKGQDVAVRALAALLERGHDLELELVGSVFAGYEWFERDLVDLADRLGVGDRLLLAGFRSGTAEHYAAADVVLVPSRLEPFGSVAVEALAAHRPVVVSRVGGLPEIVDDGETGVVVPPDSPAALADAVDGLLRDPARAAALATAGARSVRERFRLERYERELLDVLRRTAAR